MREMGLPCARGCACVRSERVKAVSVEDAGGEGREGRARGGLFRMNNSNPAKAITPSTSPRGHHLSFGLAKLAPKLAITSVAPSGRKRDSAASSATRAPRPLPVKTSAVRHALSSSPRSLASAHL